MQILIDAAPIIRELGMRADRPKGKNPYENIKITAYRWLFEKLMNAQVVEPVAAAGGCYCAECRFNSSCAMREPIQKGHELYHKETPPFCSFGEPDPDILNAPSLGELAGPDPAGE